MMVSSLFRASFSLGSPLLLAWGLIGCYRAAPAVLGTPPTAQKVVTTSELAKLPAGETVTLQGEMIEKCPTAGCWFVLRDKTGTLRVDTKAAGFVVTEVPLHTTMTVAGKVTQDDTPGLAATGVQY